MKSERIDEKLAAARAASAWAKFQRQCSTSDGYKVYQAMRNHMIRYSSAVGASQRVMSRVFGVQATGAQLSAGANDAQLLTMKNLCERYINHLSRKRPGAQTR
jgi:hypothetical protein